MFWLGSEFQQWTAEVVLSSETAVTETLPLTGGWWFNKCLAMQKHTAVQTAMHPQTFNNQCSNEAAYEVTEYTY